MPRLDVPVLVLAALIAVPAAADTLTATSQARDVTLYPWGASITRAVTFEAPAGRHTLHVTDLPAGIPVESLRLAAGAGLRIGSVTLATGRLPAAEAPPSPEFAAAEADVERLEAVLRDRDAAIAAIRLKVDAANEQWNFLRGLAQSEATAGLDVEGLRGLARMIGEETLAARQSAQAAELEAQAAERAREDDVEALEDARRALAALKAETEGRSVLTLTVEAEAAGAQSLAITSFTEAAGWRPVYDLRLTRGTTPELEVERSVFVSQASGEDWRGVTLTLSTARPSERSAPAELYPIRRWIVSEAERSSEQARTFGDGVAMFEAAPAAPEPVADVATLDLEGATVVYRYAEPVDLRDGVEDLRLRLDTLSLAPELRAVAVPRYEDTAYLVAKLVNDSGQVLLPGAAQLFLDGALVGGAELPLTAAGAEARIGFGAIDGLILSRRIPARTEGARGILTSRNQFDEVAVLTVENLTGEAWAVRLLDQVPYSEQDDLEIAYSSTQPASETDIDGLRGTLAWEFDLGAGSKREVRLEHNLKWPEGYELR